MYKVRGAPPRPVPDDLPRSPWKAPLLLVGSMIGWMLFMMALAAFAGPSAASNQSPLPLGQGVTVTPADGWVSAENVWDVGPGAISLQRAGVLVAFGADSYLGTTEQLLEEQLIGLEQQFGSFRSLPPASTTMSPNVPALRVLFSGTADSSNLEGELVVGSSDGTGIVMLAVAPSGQIARVQSDLDVMLESIVIPQ